MSDCLLKANTAEDDIEDIVFKVDRFEEECFDETGEITATKKVWEHQ